MKCFCTIDSQKELFYLFCKDKKKKKLKMRKEVIHNEEKKEELKK